MGLVREDGFIPGQVDDQGQPTSGYCCLTGNCQLAFIWARQYEELGDLRLLRAAERSLEYVMSCQDIATTNPDIRGAISGSQPIWGRYSPLTFPNWAAKFFVDAMLLRLRLPS